MGWLGSALILLGAWHIGHKRRMGFTIAITGSLCWVYVGISNGMFDLVFIESAMILMAVRNWRKWGNDRQDKDADPGRV